MSDIFHGTVPLPDGRQCKAYVRGINHSDTFWEPGYYEIDENDPLVIEAIDGAEPDESEYDKEYAINGETVMLAEYVIDWLLDHGRFEAGEVDYE